MMLPTMKLRVISTLQASILDIQLTYPTESQGSNSTLWKSLTIEGTKSATIVPSREYVNMLERIATTTRVHYTQHVSSDLMTPRGLDG